MIIQVHSLTISVSGDIKVITCFPGCFDQNQVTTRDVKVHSIYLGAGNDVARNIKSEKRPTLLVIPTTYCAVLATCPQIEAGQSV